MKADKIANNCPVTEPPSKVAIRRIISLSGPFDSREAKVHLPRAWEDGGPDAIQKVLLPFFGLSDPIRADLSLF